MGSQIATIDEATPRRRWPRFRIASLLWLTFAVACFFAGQRIGPFEFARPDPDIKGSKIKLAVGQSVVISDKSQITRISVNHPNLVSVIPFDPGKVQIAGLARGRTGVQVWNRNGQRTSYTVSVRP